MKSTKDQFKNAMENAFATSNVYNQGPEGFKAAAELNLSLKETKKVNAKKSPVIKKSIKSAVKDKLVGKTPMKLPIGKLGSIGGKMESKEATGSGSAGGYVTALESKQEKIKGGLSDKKTLEDIAKKHDKKGYYHIDDMVSSLKKQLNKGIKVEMEHTDSKKIAKEIAMDHLWEDPKYYDKLSKIEGKKTETKEATGSGSAGSYETTSIWAKSTNKKDWVGARKPIYKGGKFVTVKKKCKTFPYCNQGDIKALKIYENKVVQKVINKISKEQNINENVIKAIIQNQLEKKGIITK